MPDQKAAALSQGVIAGFIGYMVFVIFFAVTNTVAGESPFHTAHLIGSALLRVGNPAAGAEAAPVLAYNGIHLLAAILIGIVASFLFLEVELHPMLWYLVMFLFIAGLLYSVAVGGIIAGEIAGAVSWGQVVAVNVLAALFSGIYLYRAHPRLRDRVRRAAD